MIDTAHYKNIIEAVLLVAGEPLTIERLQNVFEEHERPTSQQLQEIIELLMQDYQSRGIELKKLASGYLFQAKQDYANWIARLFEEKPPRYSRALLETLAIVAYRQPVTRAEIEDIRGVAVSSHIMKTLLERGWVRIVGYRDVLGKPGIYATTKSFLDYFNLNNLDELPSLQDIKDKYNTNNELPLDLDFPPAIPEIPVELDESIEEIEEAEVIEITEDHHFEDEIVEVELAREELVEVEEVVEVEELEPELTV